LPCKEWTKSQVIELEKNNAINFSYIFNSISNNFESIENFVMNEKEMFVLMILLNHS
jgi:hypothetical protein